MKPKLMEGAEIFIVVKNDRREIVMEHYDSLLNWLDDQTAQRVRMVWRGMNEFDAANPMHNVGETFWWTPASPRTSVETTHLDAIAKRQVARARGAIPTLPDLSSPYKLLVVLWDDLGITKISSEVQS